MRKYLAIDDRWIDRSYAVHRRPLQFAKHPANPVVSPDQPWEGNSVYCFGSAIEEAGGMHGRYRLWYQVYSARNPDPRFETAVGYAESDDGIHWRKPSVGVGHDTHGATNLVWLSSGRSHLYSPAVVRDERAADPAARYKLLYWDAMTEADLAEHRSPYPVTADVPGWRGLEGEGAFVCTSPDGIAWTKAQPVPVFSGPCDATTLTQLDDGRFLATVKTSERGDRHFRVIAETLSDDAIHWPAPATVLEPDWHDAPGTEFYGMPAFDYFGNRLGLIWIYHNAPDDKRVDVQLALWDARDGWQRAPGRHTLLPTGERGEWDAGCIYTASQPIVAPAADPQSLWLYYGGANVRHDDQRYQRDCIGLATLRLDAFAALEAGHFPGTVASRPLTCDGTRLHVNLAGRHGTLQAQLRDAASGELLARSRVLRGADAVDAVLEWESGAPPRRREITLEFALHRARLFSFWFD